MANDGATLDMFSVEVPAKLRGVVLPKLISWATQDLDTVVFLLHAAAKANVRLHATLATQSVRFDIDVAPAAEAANVAGAANDDCYLFVFTKTCLCCGRLATDTSAVIAHAGYGVELGVLCANCFDDQKIATDVLN